MLRRTEMIALPIKRKLLHKCCVIYTPNTGHEVVCVIIEKNENALESLFCTVRSTWMKEEQYGKVSSRNAHVVIFDNDTPCFFVKNSLCVWQIYHRLKCTRSSS